MTEPTRWQESSEERAGRQIREMQLVTNTSKEVMDQISYVHSYAAYKVVETLRYTQQQEVVARLRGCTPAEEAALHYLKQCYLQRMCQIAADSGAKQVYLADRVTLEVGGQLVHVTAPAPRLETSDILSDDVTKALSGS